MITLFRGEYGFLSNFFPCEVEYGGIIYPSSEHAYQAAKTDDETQKLAFKYGSPGEAKKLGATFKPENWRERSLSIMLDILRQKFSKATLKSKLLDTYPHELIEGNTWGDTFWGKVNGVGENHLGKLLMQVRQELKEQ